MPLFFYVEEFVVVRPTPAPQMKDQPLSALIYC